jgi:hypothetical protein
VTVGEVCADLFRHPIRGVIHRWHWKSAILSAVLRGGLFFATNFTDGPGVALRVTLVECVLRVPLVGMLAAVAQALGGSEPPWAAAIVAMSVLPGLAHVAELAVHWAARTPELGASMGASVALSALSTLFNLFATRRGVMIVGRGALPFGADMQQLPRLLVDFVLVPSRAFGRMLRGVCLLTTRR